jgi:acetyltransferase-like isoleucine patch superfamily enzyme
MMQNYRPAARIFPPEHGAAAHLPISGDALLRLAGGKKGFDRHVQIVSHENRGTRSGKGGTLQRPRRHPLIARRPMAGLQTLLAPLIRRWRLHRVNRLPYGSRGPNVILFNGSHFDVPERIFFGRDIYVGPDAFFMADGGIRIHDNVIFGPRVSIFTSNHQLLGADYLPYGPVSELGEVVIHSHCWIGAYSILLPGVRIGEGAVVAAGSVVARNVPPLAFVAGNPAQVRRYRDPEEYLRLKREGRFFMALRGRGPVEYSFVPREQIESSIGQTPEALAQRERLGLDRYDFEG